MRLNLKKWVLNKWVLTVAAAMLVALLATCAFFRISRPRDVMAYTEMALTFHPVWKQFALRRYAAGDSAEPFLQAFPPTRKWEFGRYGVYEFYPHYTERGLYFAGFYVTTRDGKLLRAQAHSCEWQFDFFCVPDAECDRQHREYIELLVRNKKEAQRSASPPQ
jgi:hypothetical protein